MSLCESSALASLNLLSFFMSILSICLWKLHFSSACFSFINGTTSSFGLMQRSESEYSWHLSPGCSSSVTSDADGKMKSKTKLKWITNRLQFEIKGSLSNSWIYGQDVLKGVLREDILKTVLLDLVWKIDFAHFLSVARLSCTYSKTVIRWIKSFNFVVF